MALNALADYTPEEFQSLRSTKHSPSTWPVATPVKTTANPATMDWRDKGAVTPVCLQRETRTRTLLIPRASRRWSRRARNRGRPHSLLASR